ncbi:4Fe-4S binding protein [Chloroflexota bacterium]
MKLNGAYEGPWVETGVYATYTGLKTGDWRYQRPVIKENKCCKCGTCYIFCTIGCIEERETNFAADLEYCKGCGICAAMCPNNAIYMVREEWE